MGCHHTLNIFTSTIYKAVPERQPLALASKSKEKHPNLYSNPRCLNHPVRLTYMCQGFFYLSLIQQSILTVLDASGSWVPFPESVNHHHQLPSGTVTKIYINLSNQCRQRRAPFPPRYQGDTWPPPTLLHSSWFCDSIYSLGCRIDATGRAIGSLQFGSKMSWKLFNLLEVLWSKVSTFWNGNGYNAPKVFTSYVCNVTDEREKFFTALYLK